MNEKERIEQINNLDIENTLGKMSENDLIREEYDKKENELVYSLTEKGLKEVRKLLKTDDGVLMYFLIFIKTTNKPFNESLFLCAEFFAKKKNINLLTILKRTQNKYSGFKINWENNETKKLISYFDKIIRERKR